MTGVQTCALPIFEFRAEASDDGLTLEGIAAVFNQETVIDSMWEGNFREQIAPGAFARTLVEDRAPVLQFDHGSHPLIGSIPLGRIEELGEVDEGLFVRARLSDNWLVEPVRDAIRDGAVTGMSFRFQVNDETVEKGKHGDLDLRTINDVTLHELGPVVFPAYPQTTVGVRSDRLRELVADPDVLRELAELLLEQRGDATSDGVSTTSNGNAIALAQARARKTALKLRGM